MDEFSDAISPAQYVEDMAERDVLKCVHSCDRAGCVRNTMINQCVPAEVDADIKPLQVGKYAIKSGYTYTIGEYAKRYFQEVPEKLRAFPPEVLEEYCAAQSKSTCYAPCIAGYVIPCRYTVEGFYQAASSVEPQSIFGKYMSVYTRFYQKTSTAITAFSYAAYAGAKAFLPLVPVSGFADLLAYRTFAILNPLSRLSNASNLVNVNVLTDIFGDKEAAVTTALAPLTEEIVFRGTALLTEKAIAAAIDKLDAILDLDRDMVKNAKKINSIVWMLTSSITFAYAHAGNEDALSAATVFQCAQCFIAGIVYYIVAKKHGLSVSVIAHHINNLTAAFTCVDWMLTGMLMVYPAKFELVSMRAFHEKHRMQIQEQIENTLAQNQNLDMGFMDAHE